MSSSYKDNKSSISNKELSECDREDLRHIGSIQGDCGHVIFIKYPSGEIIATDENIHDIAWIRGRGGGEGSSYTDSDTDDGASKASKASKAPSLLGDSLQKWIPYTLYLTIFDCVNQMKQAESHRTFTFYTHRNMISALSISSTLADFSVVGVEIEPASNAHETADSFCTSLVHLGRIVEFYANEAIAGSACDAIYNVMGHYDRGMVYRFNDDLSGEIIHEMAAEGLTSSYLGLRFPASDIPLPARELYVKNGLRYIHNLEEDNVPILSQHGAPVDLTQIRMRAVAKPHVVYLRNMGVKSSLSIAIVVNGELWGLLAFHGYNKPFQPALHQRIACEAISKMVSVRIESSVKKQQSSRIIRLGEILMHLNQDQSIIANLHDIGESILAILDCDVLVAVIQDAREDDGNDICVGDRTLKPPPGFWKHMSTYENRKICAISEWKQLKSIGLSEEDSPKCGILYFREGRTQIMLGRAVRAKDVYWAGNPDEPKLRIGGILNPRASFATFMEKARKESRAWSAQDLTVASSFRDRVCEHCHKFLLTLLSHDIADTNKRYLAAIDQAQDNYDFFARMSHELRTPFHGVMGCLEILDETFNSSEPDEVRDTIRTALSSGAHMIDLLNDILDISKNKHLSHNLATSRVVYQSLAYDSIDCMRTLATTRNIQFSFSVQPKAEDEKITIVTDRKKIIQIASNIVSNAIKFTKKGVINVNFNMVDTLQDCMQMWQEASRDYIGVVCMMKEGEMLTTMDEILGRTRHYPHFPDRSWLLVEVIDSGCGMAPTDLTKMFRPYTQASAGSNRAFQGTGLGLYICVSLCTQLSGFLACASTPEKGTVFHFGIPVERLRSDDALGSIEAIRAAALAKEANRKVIRKGPILVVDDNQVNLKILKRQIGLLMSTYKLSNEILTAGGVDECLAIYKERRPPLIFIDYHMPGKDGLEGTMEIRAWECQHEIPPAYIVCYTADGTDYAKSQMDEAGCDDILLKPPPKGALERIITLIDGISK